jgi:hypothetical protein
MPAECHGKHIFIATLESRTLVVQEENGHNNSFSLGTGHGSVLELEEE